MSDDAEAGRGSRVRTVLGSLVFLVIIAYLGAGLTYIPLVRDTLPSFITVEPTTRVSMTDPAFGAGVIPADMITMACHNIPFLIRPLAGGSAHTARIIFTGGGRDLGEMRFDCRDGSVLSERQY